MNLILVFLTENGAIVVAGCFGGVLRWVFLKTRVWDGLVNVVIGGGLAYYLTPWAAPMLAQPLSVFTADISRIEQISGLGVGIIGIGIVGAVMDWWEAKKKQLIGGADVVPAPPAPAPPKGE